MTYAQEDLETLQRDFAARMRDLQELLDLFLSRTYRTEKAREYAEHGFSRRVGTLVRCLENIFGELPPEQSEVPSREARKDAEINIQSYVFNMFGALENLAWIWVEEKGVVKANGRPLHRSNVGLGSRCERVRASFTEPFQEKLTEFQNWFDHIEDFRHSLAHRIPLYIPPHMVSAENTDEYRRLEREMQEATRTPDLGRHAELEREQNELMEFKAVMTHSFSEQSPIAFFHAQTLADAATLHEIAMGILAELDTLERIQDDN